MTERTCQHCGPHSAWTDNGIQHTGEVDGGTCHHLWTCGKCGSTGADEFDCEEHTRTEAIELIAEEA